LELVRRATDLRQRVYDQGGSTAERRERVELNELEELYQELRKNMNLLSSELKKSFPDGPSSGWAEFQKEVDEVFKPYFQLSIDDHPPRIAAFLAQSSVVSPSSQILQLLPQSPVPGDGEHSIFEIDQDLAHYVTPDAASFLARDNAYRPSHPLHLLNARVPFWVAGTSQHASSTTVSGVDDLETSQARPSTMRKAKFDIMMGGSESVEEVLDGRTENEVESEEALLVAMDQLTLHEGASKITAIIARESGRTKKGDEDQDKLNKEGRASHD